MQPTHVSATSVLAMHKFKSEEGGERNFSSFTNSKDTLKSICYSQPRNSDREKINTVSRSLVQELSIVSTERRSKILKRSLSTMDHCTINLKHTIKEMHIPVSPLKAIACDMLRQLSFSSDEDRLKVINEALAEMDRLNDCRDPGYESQSSSPIMTPASEDYHDDFKYPESSDPEVESNELNSLPNRNSRFHDHACTQISSPSSQRIYHSRFSDCVKNRLNAIAEQYKPLAEESLTTESHDKPEMVPDMITSAVKDSLAAFERTCTKREVLDEQMSAIKEKLKQLPNRRKQLELDVNCIQDKLRNIPTDFSFYEITHVDIEMKEVFASHSNEYYQVHHRKSDVFVKE